MSKQSLESGGGGGGGSDPWPDNVNDNQSYDVPLSHESAQFHNHPIIAVISILSIFYTLLFIVGVSIAFASSLPSVNEAKEFNEIVKKATKLCQCIVSDEEWPNCTKDFCLTIEDSLKVIERKSILLHGDKESCKQLPTHQQLTCYSNKSLIEEFPWTEWTPKSPQNLRYRIRQIEPYGIYVVKFKDLIDEEGPA